MSDPMDLNHDGTTTALEKSTYAAAVKTAKALGKPIAEVLALLPATYAQAVATNTTTHSTTNERSSSTSSDTTIYSLNQVRNAATSAYESALGRAPTQDELDSFLTSLNTYARANPVKNARTASGRTTSTDTSKSNQAGTSRTTTSSPTSTSTASTTSSGGVDVSGFAASQVEDTTEARAVRVDSLFRGAMNVLANQIGG